MISANKERSAVNDTVETQFKQAKDALRMQQSVAAWLRALLELMMLWQAARTRPETQNGNATLAVRNRVATVQDIIEASLSSGAFPFKRNAPVHEQNETGGGKPAPRAQDVEQLSSAGHGRVKEVVNGVVVYEAWYRHGKLHGEHGAALTRRDPVSGEVIEEGWMKAGKLQRTTGPAWIQQDAKTGVVTSESWWREGRRHRIDAPALVVRDAKTGQVTGETWFEKGAKLNAPMLAASMIRDTLKNMARHLTLS